MRAWIPFRIAITFLHCSQPPRLLNPVSQKASESEWGGYQVFLHCSVNVRADIIRKASDAIPVDDGFPSIII
ncbi:hypothetical protein Q6333_29240, partial [Klebsiella pneumoniae]